MKAEFKPRLVKPEKTNKYYISKAHMNADGLKGYSPCILGNELRRDKYLNVLPNCVGWATGRFNEIGGYGYIKYAPKGNACNFINDCGRLGLRWQPKPTLGGIMVWSGGKMQAGHVAIAEVLHPDGSVTTSESEWNGKAFVTYRRAGKDYTDGCYWMSTPLYKYLGCIVNPWVEDKDGEDDMSYEQFAEYMDKYIADLSKKEPASWAEDAVNRLIKAGIMNGNDKGQIMAEKPVTRQELAVVLCRAEDKTKF